MCQILVFKRTKIGVLGEVLKPRRAFHFFLMEERNETKKVHRLHGFQ